MSANVTDLTSLSIFVGTGQCNAHCSHCAGAPLRKFGAETDGQIDNELIYKTLIECHQRGARYLSLSSSGEPTLSPISITRTLEIVHEISSTHKYKPINMYTNGIRIGMDDMTELTEAEKIAQAVAEGYPDKDEECPKCHAVFKNYHHYIQCNERPCPMSDGKGTLFEQWAEMDKQDAQQKTE